MPRRTSGPGSSSCAPRSLTWLWGSQGGTEALLECLQARNEHAVTYLGDHLVFVGFVAVELRRPFDIRVITKRDRTRGHHGDVPADTQPGGVVAERERDGPVLVVEADQGSPGDRPRAGRPGRTRPCRPARPRSRTAAVPGASFRWRRSLAARPTPRQLERRPRCS